MFVARCSIHFRWRSDRLTLLGCAVLLSASAYLALVSHTLRAEDTSPSYTKWVRELGDERFSVREQATERLTEAGATALEELLQGVQWGDQEARYRALTILTTLAQQADSETHERIWNRLSALCDRLEPTRKLLVLESLTSLRVKRWEYAWRTLEEWGANLLGEPQKLSVEMGRNWNGGAEQLCLLQRFEQVVQIDAQQSRITDQDLVEIAKISSLKKLYLGGSQVRGEGLKHLAALHKLEYLSLQDLPIQSEHMQPLADLPQLSECVCKGTELNDAALVHLAKIPQLKSLSLEHTQISHAGLMALAKSRQLEQMQLAYNKVSGEGLSALAECESLKTLSLKGVELSLVDMEYLSDWEQLESLGLDHSNLTNAHLERLTRLPRLRILWLSRTKINDDAAEELARFPQLQTVYLHGSEFTERGVAKLKQLAPQIQAFR